MRPLIFLLALLAVACKSQKEVAHTANVETDSLAHSSAHRTLAVCDSIVRHVDFRFDTLEINIQRLSFDADAPEIPCQREQSSSLLETMPSAAGIARSEIIRLRAVRGRVHDTRIAERAAVEVYNRLDTVAYHQSAAETSTEHSATTRLYNPPSGTIIGLFALMGLGIYIYIRKRK